MEANFYIRKIFSEPFILYALEALNLKEIYLRKTIISISILILIIKVIISKINYNKIIISD